MPLTDTLNSRESALLLNPSLHVHKTRVLLLQRLDVGLVTLLAEPANHDAELGHHVLEEATEEAKRAVETRASLLLEDFTDLRRVELVAGQADRFMVVLLRAAEGELGEDANVGSRYPLQWLVAESVAERCHENLGGETGSQVVHEGNCQSLLVK